MSSVEQVLKIASAQVGYVETKGNRTKFGKWYGMDGQPWCAFFVSWVFHQAGIPLNIQTEKGFSYCPSGVAWFKKNNKWHTKNPQPGDIVFFDWYPGTSRSGAYHVGIVKQIKGNNVITIEGNTSIASNDNGGSVMERTRSPRVILGYGRVELKSTKTAYPSKIVLDGKQHDAYLIDGETVIPLSVLKDKLKVVSWDNPTKTATLESKK